MALARQRRPRTRPALLGTGVGARAAEVMSRAVVQAEEAQQRSEDVANAAYQAAVGDHADILSGVLAFPYTRTALDVETAVRTALAHAGDGAAMTVAPGTYKMDRGQRFAGLRSLQLGGPGAYATTFLWKGGAGPVFEFDQCQFSGLRDVSIIQDVASEAWTEAVLIQDTRSNRPSHRESDFSKTVRSESQYLEHMLIDGLGVGLVGVRIGLGSATDAKNDQHTFYRLRIRGAVEALFDVEGQAARNLNLIDCRLQGFVLTDPAHFCEAGIRSTNVPGHGGSVFAVNCLIMNNQIDIDIGDRSGPWSFLNTWFEQSKRWIRARNYRGQDSAQREFWPVSFDACRWSGAEADVINPIIDSRVAGIQMRGCEIGPNAPTVQFEIYIDPAYDDPHGGGIFEGCRFGVPNRYKIFRGRYPASTRGSWCNQGTLSSDVFSLDNVYDGVYFKPQYVEDLVARGIRAPRALHCFEEQQYLEEWQPDTVYAVHDEVYNFNGSNAWGRYLCITPGTSASSGGPVSTTNDETDGTVHWRHVGDGQFRCFDRQMSRLPQLPLYGYGGPTLDSSLPGFTGPLVDIAEVADQGLAYNDNDGILDPQVAAFLAVGLVHLSGSAGANRGVFSVGGQSTAAGGGPWVSQNAADQLVLHVGAATVTGAHAYAGELVLMAVLVDPDIAGGGGAARFRVVTRTPGGAVVESLNADADLIAALGGAGLGNVARKGWGAAANSRTAAPMKLRWDALWYGVDAVDLAGATSIESLLERLG